jgi:hypothetical protein
MPWTGYWYQLRTNLFAKDTTTPLQESLVKLDKVSANIGRPVHSMDWELQHAQELGLNPDAIPEWEGLCDAWALAALLRPEPTKALELHGVIFTVADQKALLTKLYESNDLNATAATYFGSRYYGDADTDGELQDPRPEAFHRIAEVMLGERGLAFGIDSDPGIEVWQKPLFKMSWVVAPDPKIPNAYVVTAFPKIVRPLSKPSNLTTAQLMELSPIVEAPEYRYRLYVDPTSPATGKRRVIYGEWLDSTRDQHPDSIFVPDPNKALKPANPEVGQAQDIIKSILQEGVPVPS